MTKREKINDFCWVLGVRPADIMAAVIRHHLVRNKHLSEFDALIIS